MNPTAAHQSTPTSRLNAGPEDTLAPARDAQALPPAAGSGPLRSTLLFLGRSLRTSSRDVEALLMDIALPVMLMLLFVSVFGGAMAHATGDYVNYVVPGVLLLCAGFGAAGVAVTVTTDAHHGPMQRFRTMPVVASASVLGNVFASLVRSIVPTTIVIAIAIGLGFRAVWHADSWLLALALVGAWTTTVTLVYALIGLLTKTPQGASGAGFVLLFLPYVSSAFAPIDTLPEWLRPVAEHQPVTPIVEAIRAALVHGDVGPTTGIAFAWCLGLSLIAIVLLAWRYRRMTVR